MMLHYTLKGNGTPILFLHGLFGSLANLNQLAQPLQSNYTTLQVDLCNHGLSPHRDEMDYTSMAQAVLTLLDQLGIETIIVIGHSMGGKVAMQLAQCSSQRVSHLIVLDIAPVQYPTEHHGTIFTALQAVQQAKVTQRSAAAKILRNYLQSEPLIQFFLTSFAQGKWRFNLPVLIQSSPQLTNWTQTMPWFGRSLFIRGGSSQYITEKHVTAIQTFFPHATIVSILGADHWVHIANRDAVLQHIRDFITV